MIVIIKPKRNILTVNFILPFCTPLKININISNMSNIIGVGTIFTSIPLSINVPFSLKNKYNNC